MPCGGAPQRACPLRSEPSRMTVSYLSHPNARRPMDAAARHLDTQGFVFCPVCRQRQFGGQRRRDRGGR